MRFIQWAAKVALTVALWTLVVYCFEHIAATDIPSWCSFVYGCITGFAYFDFEA